MSDRKPTIEAFQAFFREEYEREAPGIEGTGRVPLELRRRLAESGALRLTVPEEHGGFGLGMVDALPYLEAAGMGHGSGRMLVHVANGLWRSLAGYGNPQQRSLIRGMGSGDVVLALGVTEREGGGGRDLHARAVRDGDCWRLSGEKHLVTFGQFADWFLLLSATDDRAASDSFSMFAVPRGSNGLVITPQPTMGLAGIGLASLRFDGVTVGGNAILGRIGQGLAVAGSFLDYSRVSLCACMVGLAQRALDQSIDFARQRTTFGKPIAERQAIQVHLANMHADISAARSLVWRVAERYQRGELVSTEAATAKLFCAGMVGRVTDLALRVHGGLGYTKETPLERIYREARAFWFEEGTAEVQQVLIARRLLAG
jgi:alkylation response protein AidB-like acyl-CoA dehydrogenase